MKSEPPVKMTWAEALLMLLNLRYTGLCVIHYAEGHPKLVELPGQPARFTIDNDLPLRET